MSGGLIECWHGSLSRSQAVRLLQSRGIQQGMFLCRAGQGGQAPVISLVAHEDVQHFVVQSSPQHLCMRLEGGPWFVGLDELIRHYSHGPNGLPCQLVEPCPGDPLPPELLASGPDTVLHGATRNHNLQAVHEIALQDLNLLKYRDRAGRTCLHLAVLGQNPKMVDLLLKLKSDSRLRDCDGCSPVHLAARNNQVESLILLCKHGAELTARIPTTGWSPLHEAAYAGHLDVTEKLLELGVPVHPRCGLNRTPAELARTRGHMRVCDLIEGWTAQVRVRKPVGLANFLHGPIDRHQASDMCIKGGNGAFLVRESRRRPGDLVLTVNFMGQVFNYEVRNGDHLWYSIDEGPLFESIEMLIDYYMKNADGLPGKLTGPIESIDEVQRGLQTMQIAKGPPGQSNGHHMQQQQPPPPQQPQSTILPPVGMHRGPPMPHTDVPQRRAPQMPDQYHGQQQQQQQQYDPNEFKGAEAPHIPHDAIETTEQLGEGEFGSVLKGIWHPGGANPPRHVAIKTLRTESLVNGEKEFVREAAVMARLTHPSIVTLYGVCREARSGTLMLVQELLHIGSALEFILNHAKEVGLKDFRIWAAQIAAGMDYLEERRLVHRDLALRNILLASQRRAKISDFGLSRAVGTESDYYRASKGGRWPVKWYAPESVNYGTFSSKSDVWGFGITLWEMWSWGAPPYGSTPGSEVIRWIEEGGRLAKPDRCPEKVYIIMRQCWEYEPRARPTFRDLLQIFRREPEFFEFNEG